MTDSELGVNIQTELAYEPSLDHADIQVAVNAGTATLTGTVESYPMFLAAERVALRVPGVRGVVNEITVELPEESIREDDQLAVTATSILECTAHVPARHIKIQVENGRLTLHGDVEHPHEREAAERAVQYLIGVRKVINDICVTAKRHANGTAEHLVAALRRSAISHSCDIHVQAHGDHITLSGTVPTWADRDEVVRIAWAAPGVRHVNCHVHVVPPPRHKAHSAGHS